jgi:TolB-like protein/Flp pilus assembly protein TadD
MASVWEELKRRNVVRVAVAYAVVAWLLIEVASTVFPILQLPGWTVAFVTMLLIMGFPLALILSWAYGLTPDGMKRAKSVPLSESITNVTGRKIDFVIIGVLILAVSFMFVDNYLAESGPFAGAEIDPASLVEPQGVNAELSEPPTNVPEEEQQREVLPNSVAVLPLENLSPDPDNAYFAAGMHEEILNHLAKLSNLNVISRTSVVRYADSGLSIPEIADELNVETVIEGSVRYANNRVLVTVQLIDPETDAHLWSESYNRDLSDVFAIQADIAMNVANSLQAEFSISEQERIEEQPTDSPAAYALYLKALSSLWTETAPEDLDRAIELDPEFAEAYALKAYHYASLTAPNEEVARVVTQSAERALELDPNLGNAYVALGLLHQSLWRGAEAEAALEQAYRLSPNDPSVLTEYARFKRYVGDYEEAVRADERAVELDPNSRLRHSQLGASYSALGEDDRAAASFRRAIELEPSNLGNHVQFALLEASRGRESAALRELQIAEELDATNNPVRLAQMAVAYARIGRSEDAERLFKAIERIAEEMPLNDALWANAYFAVGNYAEARRRLANAINSQVPEGTFSYAEMRIPFTNMKSNVSRHPELETAEFQNLRSQIFSLN